MPVDIVRDAPPTQHAPPDPSVAIPPSVKAAADRAEAAHAAAYPAQATPEPAAAQVVAPVAPVTAAVAPAVPDAASTLAPAAGDPRASWGIEQWQQHARSQEGRAKAATDTVKHLQSQLGETVEELQRTQQVIKQPTAPVQALTPEDTEIFGPDLISFAQRAARAAIEPELTSLRKQVENSNKKLVRQQAAGVEVSLDAAMPNWREVRASAEFQNWLSLRDVFSRRIRRDLLNDAYKAADAASVVAFFQAYQSEVGATGQIAPLPQVAAREATLPLASLVAPGHPKPAVAATAAPQDNLFITRAQVADFYRAVREAELGRGPYAGRAQDKANDEAFIQDCQRGGRIR